MAGAITRVLSEAYPRNKKGLLDLLVGIQASNRDDRNELLSFMEEVQYNKFFGADVSDWVQGLIDFDRIVGVKFGREFSPVLWLLPAAEVSMKTLKQLVKKAYLGNEEAEEVGAWLRVWWD